MRYGKRARRFQHPMEETAHEVIDPLKFAVIGAVKRKGNVIARVIDKINTPALEGFVKEAVSDLRKIGKASSGLMIASSVENVLTNKASTWRMTEARAD